jgi:ribose 5-phosphate isomerase RpiB
MRVALAGTTPVSSSSSTPGHGEGLGHEVTDPGIDSEAPVDYPDFAEKPGTAVREGRADRVILP